MGKLGIGSVIARAVAWVGAAGALAATSACALLWGIQDPIPTGDEGASDTGIIDETTGNEPIGDDDGPVDDADDSATDSAMTDGPMADAVDAGDDASPPGYTISTPTPVPAFIDACSLAGHVTFLQNHDNASISGLNLPFAFAFYREPEKTYWVNTNGVMGFGPSASNLPTTQCPLPESQFNPHPAIYAFGDDLYTPMTTGVCIGITGVTPNQQLVVTWENVFFAQTMSGHLTFSVVLNQTTNTIDLTYGTMMGGTEAQGDQATIGLEDSSGMFSTQFSCRMPVITSTPLTVRFTPKP
jgi:hypothetical protein